MHATGIYDKAEVERTANKLRLKIETNQIDRRFTVTSLRARGLVKTAALAWQAVTKLEKDGVITIDHDVTPPGHKGRRFSPVCTVVEKQSGVSEEG